MAKITFLLSVFLVLNGAACFKGELVQNNDSPEAAKPNDTGNDPAPPSEGGGDNLVQRFMKQDPKAIGAEVGGVGFLALAAALFKPIKDGLFPKKPDNEEKPKDDKSESNDDETELKEDKNESGTTTMITEPMIKQLQSYAAELIEAMPKKRSELINTLNKNVGNKDSRAKQIPTMTQFLSNKGFNKDLYTTRLSDPTQEAQKWLDSPKKSDFPFQVALTYSSYDKPEEQKEFLDKIWEGYQKSTIDKKEKNKSLAVLLLAIRLEMLKGMKDD